jgi:hypothetical protein
LDWPRSNRKRQEWFSSDIVSGPVKEKKIEIHPILAQETIAEQATEKLQH